MDMTESRATERDYKSGSRDQPRSLDIVRKLEVQQKSDLYEIQSSHQQDVDVLKQQIDVLQQQVNI